MMQNYQAIILAAGRGSRMENLTKNCHKALIPIETNGKCLLDLTISNIYQSGVRDILIIVGYKREDIIKRYGCKYKSAQIRYIENKKFSKTGTMYSLYLVKDLITMSVLLIEADVMTVDNKLTILLESEHKNALLMGKPLDNGDDVNYVIDKDGSIIKIGKNIGRVDGQKGVFIGLSKCSAEFINGVFCSAETAFKAGHLLDYYEEHMILKSNRQTNLSDKIYPLYVESMKWSEVDTKEDLERVRSLLNPD